MTPNLVRTLLVSMSVLVVGASQNAVNAGRMFAGIDGNTFAGVRFHSRLAVTSQAVFVLFKGLRWFRLGCQRT